MEVPMNRDEFVPSLALMMKEHAKYATLTALDEYPKLSILYNYYTKDADDEKLVNEDELEYELQNCAFG